MIISNNVATYSFLAIFSFGKKSFENLGKLIKKSGDTIARMLRPGEESLLQCEKIAQSIFANTKTIKVAIDETQIKKIYSQFMEGTELLFDTKITRSINAYKIIVAAITDGYYIVPFGTFFSLGKDFCQDPNQSRELSVQYFINKAKSLFPNSKIIAVLDGAFATYDYLKWCIENNIATEVRMHSNRVVAYKNKNVKIREIKELKPKGRQMARTISVIWKGLPLELTAVRRIDKKGNETVVYQVATYKASPKEHAQNYRHRWPLEKVNIERTL